MMMKTVSEHQGASLEEYIAHIQYQMLVEKSDDTEFFNFGAENINFKIKVRRFYGTIEYLLIPELLTLYYQEKMDKSYKDATRNMQHII